MSTIPDSVTTAIEDALDATHSAGYDLGRSDQKASDQAAYDELAAEFEQYRKDHPADQPPPPPTVPALVRGMNYQPTPQAINVAPEKLAESARIYVDDGRSSLMQEPEFVRARNNGVEDFTLSTKDPNASNVARWLDTFPDDCTGRLIVWHEPEDNIADPEDPLTLSGWLDRQELMLPLATERGLEPWICLMAWTFNPASRRRVTDYVLPRELGLVGVAADFYPVKGAKWSQAESIKMIRDSIALFGVQAWGLGEYGVPGKADPTYAVGAIREVGPLLADESLPGGHARFADYWSQQKNASAPDYRFTSATAAAWFADAI